MARTAERRREYFRAWREKNRERVRRHRKTTEARRRARGWKRVLTPDQRLRNIERSKAHYRNNKATRLAACRERRLMEEYGITVEKFQSMVEAQGGACAICERVPAGSGQRGILHIDHDHSTGVVRALLCLACNAALGLLRDDAGLLRRAATYLDRFGAAPKPRIPVVGSTQGLAAGAEYPLFTAAQET